METESGHTVALVNYAGNTYELVGADTQAVKKVIETMLKNKHGVNFAYKFNDKIRE